LSAFQPGYIYKQEGDQADLGAVEMATAQEEAVELAGVAIRIKAALPIVPQRLKEVQHLMKIACPDGSRGHQKI